MKGGGRKKRRRKKTYEDSGEPVSRLIKTKTVENGAGLMASNGCNVSSLMLECQLVSECTIRYFFSFSQRPT